MLAVTVILAVLALTGLWWASTSFVALLASLQANHCTI
jgi:hypothetical protein